MCQRPRSGHHLQPCSRLVGAVTREGRSVEGGNRSARRSRSVEIWRRGGDQRAPSPPSRPARNLRSKGVVSERFGAGSRPDLRGPVTPACPPLSSSFPCPPLGVCKRLQLRDGRRRAGASPELGSEPIAARADLTLAGPLPLSRRSLPVSTESGSRLSERSRPPV